MPRSTNVVASRARRKRVLQHARGYWGRRKNVWTIAKNAVEKGWEYAYEGRKQRKRQFRSLWIQRLNAGARKHNLSYSKLMHLLKENNIQLNRKALADLAANEPQAFEALIESITPQ